MFRICLFGIFCFTAVLEAQLGPSRSVGDTPGHPSHIAGTSPYWVPLLSASGEDFAGGVFRPYDVPDEPAGVILFPDLPDRDTREPISGVISVHDLQYPIPKKALKDAYEAERFAHKRDFSKAAAKLEDAIRMAPHYRDAHLNLGVLYARLGRTADARAEFQKALDIGPLAPIIYVNLALISLASQSYQEAESLARKALELDPRNRGAQQILAYATSH